MKKNSITTQGQDFCPTCGQYVKTLKQKKIQVFDSRIRIGDVFVDLADIEIDFLVNFINSRGLLQEKITRIELPSVGRPFIIDALELDHKFSAIGETIKSLVLGKLKKGLNL